MALVTRTTIEHSHDRINHDDWGKVNVDLTNPDTV